MKPAITIGIVVALIILVGGLLVPRFIQPGASKAALAAREQAELAKRELYRYDTRLGQLQRRADLPALKDADMDEVVSGSQDEFNALDGKFRKEVGDARRRTEEFGMSGDGFQQAQANAAGVRAAVTGVDALLKENDALLQAAADHAAAAVTEDRNALGVSFVEGMVHYVRAAKLLTEAEDLRRLLGVEQARLLEAGTASRIAQAQADLYAGLDVADVLVGLRQDLKEIEGLLEEATAEGEELEKQVAAREQELDAVRIALKQARAEMIEVEERGFAAGDDAAFAAYRDQYLKIAERLRTLQEEEQRLANGGMTGAELDEDDLINGVITGGETIQGLDELQRRLAIAEDRAQRLANAKKGLDDRISYVEESGKVAQAEEDRFTGRIGALRPAIDAAKEEVARLATEAFGKEDDALKAARKAISAFNAADAAAGKWVGDAQSVRGSKDPNRKNERLTMMVSDEYVKNTGASAAAAAQVLAGRIYAQRLAAIAAHINVFENLLELTGDAYEAEKLQEIASTSRSEGIQVLDQARAAYEKLVDGARGTREKEKWISQAGLATVYYLLSKIDNENVDEHLSNAAAAISSAVSEREQSPYLATHVEFRNHLRDKHPDAFVPVEEDAGGMDEDEEYDPDADES